MSTATRRRLGSVLNEGDSLAVGSADYLHDLMSSTRTRAAVGRTSTQGYNDLTGTSKSDTLIVQLGTNDTDTSTFSANVKSILSWAGDDALVFWVNVSRGDLGGTSDEDINKILRNAASSHKNLRIVDWYHAVRTKKVSLSDGIHPTATGYKYRAKLIHDTILAALKEGTSDHAREPASRAGSAPVALIGDRELGAFLLDIVDKDIDDISIRDSILDGEVSRALDAPAQITVTVHDQARAILRSGALEDRNGELRAVDAFIDDWWFRLVKLAKQGNDLVLTFEDRDVVWLRAKKGPRKAASRARTTRAEYILRLIRSVKHRRIHTGMYQLHAKRPLAKISEEEKKRKSRAARKAREKQQDKQDDAGGGFEPGAYKKLGIKKGQMENIAVFLTECDLLGATDRPRLAGLCAGFGESQWSKAAKDWKTGRHQGVFQSNQDDPAGIPPQQLDVQSHHFLVGGRTFRAGGAIGAAKKFPSWTPGAIALYVEVSDADGASHYDVYRSKADKILAAWTKGSGGTSGSQADKSTSAGQYYKRWEFKVDKDEDYWEAIQRMASEVKWRAWLDRGVFYYWPETGLYRQPAHVRFAEGETTENEIFQRAKPKPVPTGQMEYVYTSNIDFDWDYRKEVARATITCRHDHRWAVTPGTVGIIEDMGPLSNSKANEGRWLIFSNVRGLFSKEATVVVTQPMQPRAEPRSQLMTRNSKDSSGGTKEKNPKSTGRSDNAYVKVDPGNGTFVQQTTRPDGKRVLPNEWLMDFLVDLAGACGHTIYTNTYTRHKQFSSSNLQSDHWVGNGVDLNTTNHGGNWPSAYGTQIAEQAFKLTGQGGNSGRLARGGGTYTRFGWEKNGKTYSVQVLWGPNVGHIDHVHIGVRPA